MATTAQVTRTGVRRLRRHGSRARYGKPTATTANYRNHPQLSGLEFWRLVQVQRPERGEMVWLEVRRVSPVGKPPPGCPSPSTGR
jgi:hypothetical protein